MTALKGKAPNLMNSDIDEKVVNHVAKAIYNEALKAARAELSNIDFSSAELPNLFSKLIHESETGQVLIFASYLEDRINFLTHLRMKHLSSKREEEEVFGTNGPLSTLSNKVALAYQMDWISGETRTNLNRFRKIRNHFAHEAFNIGYSTEKVASHFSKILAHFSAAIASAANVLIEARIIESFVEVEKLPLREKNLCSMALLAGRLFEEFLILPIALKHHVSPTDLSYEAENPLSNVKEIGESAARALICVLQM